MIDLNKLINTLINKRGIVFDRKNGEYIVLAFLYMVAINQIYPRHKSNNILYIITHTLLFC